MFIQVSIAKSKQTLSGLALDVVSVIIKQLSTASPICSFINEAFEEKKKAYAGNHE